MEGELRMIRNSSLLNKALGLAVILVFYNLQALAGPDFRTRTAQNEIKIVSYNVQNLFDLEHDAGKNDWEFLPRNYPGKTAACNKMTPHRREACLRTDWTAPRLRIKIQQIVRALKAQGSLPDILGISEIENIQVAELLSLALGYNNFKITNSPDKRGIDVAIFWRTDKLKYIEHEEIVFDPSKSFPTRNILKVNFLMRSNSGAVLGVFLNHWPSQAAPPESRIYAARVTRSAVTREIKRIGSRYHAVVMGDFNTLSKEVPNAFSNVLTNPVAKPLIYDVQAAVDRLSSDKKSPLQKVMPPASYFYPSQMAWNRFDRFAVSANLVNNQAPSVLLNSFVIVAPKGITSLIKFTQPNSHFYGSTVTGIPWRFNFSAGTPKESGFSDHFPIGLKIRL